ncbi:hypothetical protein ACFLU5_16240, partial [Bacteroidota bacterium]
MFNSVVLDVVIGLIFIYLLYSLLASIVSELITTIFGLRARDLKGAIRRMLEDEHNRSSGKKGSDNESGTKDQIISDNFYAQPLIKYLASGKRFSKPSYITPNTFARTLIQMLKKNGNGQNDLDKIKNTLTSIAGNSGIEYNKTETGQLLQSFLDESQGDLQKFQLLLEQWFDNTMERTRGWFKRNNQVILIVIGFVIAVLFNASTFEIAGKLSKDKKAREQMVQLATAYVENNPVTPDTTKTNKKEVRDLNKKLDSLLLVKKELMSDIEDANKILGAGWTLPNSLKTIKKEKSIKNPEETRQIFLQRKCNKYIYAIVPPNVDYKTTYRTLIKKNILRGKTVFENGTVILRKGFYKWNYFWRNIFGYLVTALAISLGAPFW